MCLLQVAVGRFESPPCAQATNFAKLVLNVVDCSDREDRLLLEEKGEIQVIFHIIVLECVPGDSEKRMRI